jgi:Bacterial Ig-like domain (group 3)
MAVLCGLLVQGTVLSPRLLAQSSYQAASNKIATTTQLSIATEVGDTRTSAHFTVHVMGVDTSATPAGSVSLKLGELSLGSVLLDENGFATYNVDALPQGNQQIVATYEGSANFAQSKSPLRALDSTTSALPDYTIAANVTALTVKAGQYGTVLFTLDPENGFNQLISYSCSGLPTSASCTFTPSQVIPDGKNTPEVTVLNLQTVAQSGGSSAIQPAGRSPIYALVFPGMLALAGLAAARKRLPGLRMLGVAALLVAGGLGLSACSANYAYYHHPPTVNKGTPTGVSVVTVYASSSAGNVATVKQIALTLTVTN